MDWDVTANEMMSGYQMAHNDWAFTQRAENTKLNVAENINLNLDMAYRDGLNGNVLGGYANLDNSYRQLMTYAMPNLGEQGARELLTDYKSEYTTSFVSGLIERDPQAAIDFLSDEGNQKVLNSDRKLGALRQLAQKGVKTVQQKKIEQFKRDKTESYINFLENPTFDNLEYYEFNRLSGPKVTKSYLQEIYSYAKSLFDLCTNCGVERINLYICAKQPISFIIGTAIQSYHPKIYAYEFNNGKYDHCLNIQLGKLCDYND